MRECDSPFIHSSHWISIRFIRDLWNIDLLDTNLDLFNTDISSKHFVCLQDVFQDFLKTSSV